MTIKTLKMKISELGEQKMTKRIKKQSLKGQFYKVK